MSAPLVDHLGPWRSEPVPDTWCVVACEQGCRETWTVDCAEFDPQLTAMDVERLLTPVLLEHELWHEKADRDAPCCDQIAKTGVCYCQEDDRG